MKFVVKGEPFPLSRNKSMNSSLWEQMRGKKIYYRISLESQREPHPLISGPIDIEVTFYLKPKLAEKGKTSHISKPDLSALIYFIERIAQGTIFRKCCTINNLHAKKIYDNNPRTEITVIERDK